MSKRQSIQEQIFRKALDETQTIELPTEREASRERHGLNRYRSELKDINPGLYLQLKTVKVKLEGTKIILESPNDSPLAKAWNQKQSNSNEEDLETDIKTIL